MTNPMLPVTFTEPADIYNLVTSILEDANGTKYRKLIEKLMQNYALSLDSADASQKWGLVTIANDDVHFDDCGFYFYPLEAKCYTVKFSNFSISLDNHQLGMALTQQILSVLCHSESAYCQVEFSLRKHIETNRRLYEGTYTYATLSDSL
ncbi:hypothetical protein [Scandinavium goeteborgense]|uniref:Uncharacterized protein n=1 Tax=Scandinavium goeteborgense TaxID=1851514 RepID=A0A4V3BLV1_SCAGO|nr:hypothetical protein [Scandinavium goeteborgense]TDN48052.1 hypothetical protein EC847_1282 [Scandinavium goeteborgense]